MPLHIIIDGYNLIRRSPSLSSIDRQDLQWGREALIDRLAAYLRIKKHPITVVFDAAAAPSFYHANKKVKGIAIRFSRSGETADTEIERIASREREKALVVSSDREVLSYATAHGAATMRSDEFESQIMQSGYQHARGFYKEDIDENSGWVPTTMKKGPPRRRSKKERRNRRKINKL